MRSTLFTLLAVSAFIACSILKKDDPEKEIRAFLTQFEQSLAQTDQQILARFNAKQSNEAILAAIRVLQNKEMEYMRCTAFYNLATVTMEDRGIRVDVPVTIASENLDELSTRETLLTLWLIKSRDSFTISSLEGEEFYTNYLSLKDEIEWSVNKRKGLLDREQYFARAQQIQENYDSVIWYSNYADNTYYYVVTGFWRNYFADYRDSSKPTDYKMGLVDQNGKEIVPVGYDLIGTVGFDVQNMVEVKKDGKVGYFSLDGVQVIPAVFDFIVPHMRGDIFALVKADSVYGWISNNYEYNIGLPDGDLERLLKEYEFLPGQFTFDESTVTMCEIPNEEYVGYGIVMPPSYWVQSGVFPEIMPGFTVGDAYRNAYTEYVQTEGTLLERLTGNINALIVSIKERYLEGREEFYEYERLVFVNDRLDTLATNNLGSASHITFRRVDSTLIELRYRPVSYYYEGEGYLQEVDVPVYRYYSLSDGSLTQLRSVRFSEQTEFVKLDSSYVTGEFRIYNQQLGDWETTEVLSVFTLTFMRDEILATYGYAFTTEEDRQRFNYNKWYQPTNKSMDDIYQEATEIDKHNLDFLNRMIDAQSSPIAMLRP